MLALRPAVLCNATQDMWSFAALGLTSRLTMWMLLDCWNFEETVLGFVLHCTSWAADRCILPHGTAAAPDRAGFTVGDTEASQPGALGR